MSDDYVQQMLEYIMGTQQAGVIPVVPADPRDDQTAAQRMNYNQDWLSVQADSSAAALAGPSAYNRDAFRPTSTYSIVDTPGYQQLMAYAARGTNTPEGFIAQEIMSGGTASSAIAALQQNYTRAAADGTLDAPENAVLRAIPMGVPDQFDGTITPDWGGLTQRMTDVEQAYMTDPSASPGGGYLDPETGEMIDIGQRRTIIGPDGRPTLVDVETEPSEQSQWFTDQGLSQPSEQYTPGDLLPPEWSDNEQQSFAMQQAMMDLFNAEAHPESFNPPDTSSGKDQYANTAPTFDKGGGAVEGTGFLADQPLDLNESRVERAKGEPGDPMSYTTAPLATGSPVEMAIAAGKALPGAAQAAGSWWGQHGGSAVDTILGAAGGLWNAYQGQEDPRSQMAGQYTGGQPSTWDPNGAAEQDWLAQVAAQGQGGTSVEGFMGVGGPQQLDPQTVAMVNLMAQSTLDQAGPSGGFGRSRMLPQDKMLGGTEPPPPPAPGTVDWSQAIPGAQYNEPGAMGPPMPGGGIPPGADQRTSDFEAQRAAQFALPFLSSARTGPEPSEAVPPPNALDSPAWQALLQQSLDLHRQRTGPEPSEGAPVNPPGVLGIGDWMNQMVLHPQAQPSPPGPAMNASGRTGPEPSEGTPPENALNSLAWQELLQRSRDLSDQRTGPEPSEGVRNAPPSVPVPSQGLGGFGAPAPYGPGEQWRAQLNQSTPQTGVDYELPSGVPINRPTTDQMVAMLMGVNGARNTSTRTGAEPSEAPASSQAGWDRANARRRANEDAIAGGAVSSGLGFVNKGDDANTLMGMAMSQPGKQPSWWEQNMHPSWWQEATGRGVGGDDNDQQTRVSGSRRSQKSGDKGGQRPRMTSYKPPQRQTAELSRWRSDTQAAINSRRRDQQQNYGADFGRAAAIAYMLGQQGVTPLSTQTAARRAVVQ